MKKILVTLPLIFALPAFAGTLKLTSEDIGQGKLMTSKQESSGAGCNGSNHSPHLKWSSVPEGTKSFAVTAYDPDAPTGSGWWHWQLVNIPADITELPANAGSTTENLAPEGSMHIENDKGEKGYGGACPPKGQNAHRYQFTLYALATKGLQLPPNASGAMAGYMIKAYTIESVTIEATYKRD
ncbi:YbhB/YbcL family Raf kinase inhibitor-like protein [Vibrio algarum]|uniref:YbhB/YbcL family Raf kinase inhibitor-like protein n=1 Tax=Vibrio algarum TaxID=3020714 RepID=A0ABT4YPD6_9VIBR|nr:YbhB/YbcL family Raf kinase inhibitor-like protein [Vibrio sp. KJ40-1]MDB1123414.1 YbhB/YbcL family Raf kinase inhibitor-like protein [Vibrio sp. KJ40-1]